MNPGTATFGSDGNVKPKELSRAAYDGSRDDVLYVEGITKGMLDKREP